MLSIFPSGCYQQTQNNSQVRPHAHDRHQPLHLAERSGGGNEARNSLPHSRLVGTKLL